MRSRNCSTCGRASCSEMPRARANSATGRASASLAGSLTTEPP
ncbi:Uncharacterised protein [Bordetella pertussis]|nr:Uncharacterised protein [Bordetella pertussis]